MRVGTESVGQTPVWGAFLHLPVMCLEIPEDVDFETEELENTDVVREIVKCLGSFKTPSSQLELYRVRRVTFSSFTKPCHQVT